MNRHIFIFDLDGTIVYNGREIPKDIKESLKQLNEQHDLIFASARPIRDMFPLLEDFLDCVWIGGNGSMIRQGVNIQVTKKIPTKTCQEIILLIEKEDLDYIVDYDWNYSSSIRDAHNPILDKLDTGNLAKKVPLSSQAVSKIILFQVQPQLAQQIQDLEGIQPLYHQDVQELNITAQGIDKYTALQSLIGEADYIAFGNDKNDYQLLKHAKEGYYLGQEKLDFPQVRPINQVELENYLKSYL